MQDIVKVCKFITYDKECLKKRGIKKRKHRNQHTVSKVQVSKHLMKTQMFTFQVLFPRKISEFLKFRIQEDIMLASGEYQTNQLGNLSVHPISHQYRVTRIDKRINVLSTSVERYDLPVFPFEQLINVVFSKNPTFAKSLKNYVMGFIQECQNGALSSQENLMKLTQIKKPFDCKISKIDGGTKITTQRIFNTAFLEMMGITERMYRAYVHDTGQQPNPVYCDQQDYFFEKFGKWFDQWLEEKPHLVELINYEGQKFKSLCTFKTILVPCNVQNTIYRCCFWIYQVDDYWLNTRRCKINEQNYFTGKNDWKLEDLKTNHNSPLGRPLLRCGVKQIIIDDS